MSFFPGPPKLPPRAREVATMVVRQQKSGALSQHLIVVEKKEPVPAAVAANKT